MQPLSVFGDLTMAAGFGQLRGVAAIVRRHFFWLRLRRRRPPSDLGGQESVPCFFLPLPILFFPLSVPLSRGAPPFGEAAGEGC